MFAYKDRMKEFCAGLGVVCGTISSLNAQQIQLDVTSEKKVWSKLFIVLFIILRLSPALKFIRKVRVL